MKKYFCPYCYEEFSLGEIKCYCPNCKKYRELNEVLAIKAICHDLKCETEGCNRKMEVKCPECENKLPDAVFDDSIKNILISVVGQRAAGKSVFLGVLMHEIFHNQLVQKMFPAGTVTDFNNSLKRCDDMFQYLYNPNEQKGSLEMTKKRIQSSIKKGDYLPFIWNIGAREKTIFPSWVPILGKDKLTSFTMFMFDPAGEDLVDEEHMQAEWYRYLSHSNGLIFLLDPMHLPKLLNQLGEEKVTNAVQGMSKKSLLQDGLNDTYDVIKGLTEHIRHERGLTMNDVIDIPIAVTVPKYDVIEQFIPDGCKVREVSPHRQNMAFDNADRNQVHGEVAALLEEWGASPITTQIERDYKKVGYFCISSLGIGNNPRSGNIDTPRPHRIEDPLLWLWKENGLLKDK